MIELRFAVCKMRITSEKLFMSRIELSIKAENLITFLLTEAIENLVCEEDIKMLNSRPASSVGRALDS